MTKTGFVNAHINKTNKKYYKYHGIVKPCNIQPNPDPGYVYPHVPPGPGWEVLWDGDISFWGVYNLYYTQSNFLPSSDYDNCVKHFTDYKKRYYFCELSYRKQWAAAWLFFSWSDGEACKEGLFQAKGDYIYKAWAGTLWAGDNQIFSIGYPGPPSHYTVWRSETGEKPSYYPVPEDFYYF